MVRVVEYVPEEGVINVISQLRQRIWGRRRIARRTDASKRCLSAALIKPHQVLVLVC